MQCCRDFGNAIWTWGSPLESVDISLFFTSMSDLSPSQEMQTVRELRAPFLATDKNIEMEM
jgi:hypothetical protein